jgi:hypothetical protein
MQDPQPPEMKHFLGPCLRAGYSLLLILPDASWNLAGAFGAAACFSDASTTCLGLPAFFQALGGKFQ